MKAEEINIIHNIDCLTGLKQLPDECIDCCVTSPPYFGLRDYGDENQIGLEETPDKFVQKLVEVFAEIRRILKPQGTIWVNLGDSYNGSGKASSGGGTGPNSLLQKNSLGSLQITTPTKVEGLKPKDLIGVPWMVAFALRTDGWYLRQDIIWHKPNPMPESMTDRCTKAHEYIFLLSKSNKYYFDNEAIKTKMECCEHDKRVRDSRKRAPTKLINGIRAGNESVYEYANKRSVWTVTVQPCMDAHFATFPQDLIVDCIKAGCPENGVVLDPFMGSGTTAIVARKLNRNYIGYELNPDYIKIAQKRLYKEIGMFL